MVFDASKSVQSRPAEQFHGRFLQVKISRQNRFNIALVRGLFHGMIQLDYAAEFVVAAIISVGQNKLCVVFGGHGTNLPLATARDCEPEHKIPDTNERHSKC